MPGSMKHGNVECEHPHRVLCKCSNAIILTSIIAIVLVSSLLIQITSVAPAEALTRYYNCIARVANKNATLSLDNVDACYNLIFKGALNYYGIKQESSLVDKDTNPVDDSGSLKGQSDISGANAPSQKVPATSELYDVFR